MHRKRTQVSSLSSYALLVSQMGGRIANNTSCAAEREILMLNYTSILLIFFSLSHLCFPKGAKSLILKSSCAGSRIRYSSRNSARVCDAKFNARVTSLSTFFSMGCETASTAGRKRDFEAIEVVVCTCFFFRKLRARIASCPLFTSDLRTPAPSWL